ncbi:flavin reductase family protein [Streptomyces tricolor]|nr:flavin reductase family protein [Streptomyces tricolor]
MRQPRLGQLARDQGGGFFCVNVLAQQQRALSDRFARTGGDKFHGVDWDLSPDGAPRLAGASAWIDCRVHTEHDGGDHLVVIGDVRRLAAPADPRPPLLYHRGRYARLDDTPDTPAPRHPPPPDPPTHRRVRAVRPGRGPGTSPTAGQERGPRAA